jgi:hypothetical protein
MAQDALVSPEEFYRGRSPLGREVALAITGETPAAQALEGPGAGPGVPSAPSPEPGGAAGPAPTGGAARPAQPGGALPQILRGVRLLDQLRRAGTIGAPLSHARSPETEPAFQAQRFGEFAPQYQALLAQGWTPGQIRAAEQVLGPVRVGEPLNPEDIAGLQSLLRGDVISMPPDIAAQFLEPELFTTALREGVAPGTLTAPAAGAGAQTISPALLSSLVAFPAAIGASDPYIQRTLAAAYGQPAATALNLVGALATPFTFGASAFLPIIGAAFASMFGSPGRYWKHRRQAAQQLQAWAPILVEALPLARSREDVEWLANLINPRVRGFRLTPEGLDIAYREVAERAQPLQEYVQRVLQALPSVWESPEAAQAYFEGRPTVAQAVARQVLGALERGEWVSPVAELAGEPALFGPTFGEEAAAARRRGEVPWMARALGTEPGALPEEELRARYAALTSVPEVSP